MRGIQLSLLVVLTGGCQSHEGLIQLPMPSPIEFAVSPSPTQFVPLSVSAFEWPIAEDSDIALPPIRLLDAGCGFQFLPYEAPPQVVATLIDATSYYTPADAAFGHGPTFTYLRLRLQ